LFLLRSRGESRSHGMQIKQRSSFGRCKRCRPWSAEPHSGHRGCKPVFNEGPEHEAMSARRSRNLLRTYIIRRSGLSDPDGIFRGLLIAQDTALRSVSRIIGRPHLLCSSMSEASRCTLIATGKRTLPAAKRRGTLVRNCPTRSSWSKSPSVLPSADPHGKFEAQRSG